MRNQNNSQAQLFGKNRGKVCVGVTFFQVPGKHKGKNLWDKGIGLTCFWE